MNIQTIPLNQLVPSPLNVRKTGATAGIEELAASIAAHGLLQNLQVQAVAKGKFEVVAGGRRLAAMQLLRRQKRLEKDAPVHCVVLDESDPVEISLAENAVRLDMHPADQFDAFHTLVEQGKGEEEIAARFGVSPVVVRQRLKLARVSPALVALYREAEINLDQLMAFTITDDHAAQEAAWFEASSWNRTPRAIRATLTAAEIEVDDRRTRFVTLDAYLAAGGGLHRDLFNAEHEGYLTDPALLDRLVAERLDAEAAKLRAEGWAWVEAVPLLDHAVMAAFKRTRPTADLDEAAQQRHNDLMFEYDELVAEHGDDPEETEVRDRLDTLWAEIEAIDQQSLIWPAEVRTIGGAFLSIDYDGGLHVERGLVRPDDMRRLRSEDDEAAPAPKPAGLSAVLVESLTAERTAALRALMIDNRQIALATLCHALAADIFYPMQLSTTGCLDVRVISRDLASSAETYVTTRAGQLLLERQTAWSERLPEEIDGLFDWLAEQEMDTLLDLLAFCAAQGVNAVRPKAERIDTARQAHAERLGHALGLDMRDWWQPNAASYLGRVPKTLVLEAVREGISPQAADNLAGLKKDALVKAAQGRLAGSGWLPELLRSSASAKADSEHPAEAA